MLMKKTFFQDTPLGQDMFTFSTIFEELGRGGGYYIVLQNISVSSLEQIYFNFKGFVLICFFLTNLQTLIVAGNCTHFRMVLQRQSNNAILVFAQCILYDLQIQRYRQFKRGLLKNIETFILNRPGTLFLDNKLTQIIKLT